MKNPCLKLSLLICALGTLAVPLDAATLFWSGNGTAQGGAGTWDTTAARWGTTATGPYSTVWNNANSDNATLASTAGALTIGAGGITMRGTLTVNTTGYNTAGTPILTFTSASSINTASGVTFTMNNPYAGTVTKTGAGTLALNNSNGNTTKFNINGGTVSAASPNRFGIGADAADFLSFDGGTLSANTTEQFLLGHSITLGDGGGTLTAASAAILYSADKKISGTAGGSLSLIGTVLAYVLSDPANNWDGGLSISQPVRLAASGVIPDTALVTMNTGGTLSLGGGFVAVITKTASGTGYTTAPTISISGGGGSGATATCGLTGTTVNRIAITGLGSGYTSAPTVSFSGGGGSGAAATATISAVGPISETVKSISGTAGSITLAGGTLTVNNPAGESYSGTILIGSPTGGKVVKNGTGSWTISGGNTFDGGLTLNNGTLGVGGATAMGTGALTINNSPTIANPVSNNRTLANAVELNGNLTIDDTLFATPGNYTWSGAWTIKGANRTVTVNTAAGTSLSTITGVVGEDAAGRGLTKSGNGSLALNNSGNTYSGTTRIEAGSVNIDADGSLGNGTGTLQLAGGRLTVTANRSVAVSNPIDITTDSAIVTTSAAAAVDLDMTSGTVGGSTGTLTFRNDGADAAGDTFQPRFSGNFSFSRPIAIDNGATGKTLLQSFNTGSQTFSGVISGNGSYRRTASSAGTGGDTTFTEANTFSGGVTLSDGTIGLGSDSVGTPPALSSGPLGTGTLTVSSSHGKIQASGGARTIGNAIVLNSTLFTIKGSDSLTFSGNVDLGISSRTIQVDNTADSALTGVVSGGALGGIFKTGAGTLVLAGANTYTSETVINNGVLKVSNTTGSATGTGSVFVTNNGVLSGNGIITGPLIITNSGTIAPGASPGIITVGDTFWCGGGNYNWEITDWTGTAGSGWDQIVSTDMLTIDATASSKFTIKISSLGSAPANYTVGSKTWDIVTTVNGIFSFSPAAFDIDTTALVGVTGTFSVELSPDSHNLVLRYTPLADVEITDQSDDDDVDVLTSNYSIFVTADGSNLSYQWKKNVGGVYVDIVDDANISGATTSTLTFASFDGTNAGSYKLAISDLIGTSYSDVINLTAIKRNQGIDFTTIGDKTYGDTVTLSAVSTNVADGVPTGLTISYSVFSGPGNITGNELKFTGVGAVIVRASQSGSPNYNAATPADQTVNVNGKEITVAAVNQSRAYGSANPTLDVNYIGLAYAEDFATSGLTGAPEVTTTADATSNINDAPQQDVTGGLYPITVAIGTLQSPDGRYTFNLDDGVLTVTNRALVLAAEAKVITYGDAEPTLTWTTNGFVNGDENLDLGGGMTVLTGLPSISRDPGTDAGIYDIVIAPGTAAVNTNTYILQGQDSTLTINQASSTTTVAVNDATYDGNPHGGSAVATGIDLNQSVTVNYEGRNSTVYGPSTVPPTGAGEYTASADFAGDINHTGSSDSKNYTIFKASSITIVNVTDVTYNGNPQGGVAAATGAGGLNQSLTISYTGRNSTTYGPSTIPPTDAGDYTASASFGGDDNHDGSSNSADYAILKASSTTTITITDMTYDGNPLGGTAAATGAGGLNQSLTVTYNGRNSTAYGPSTTPPVDAGDYTASASFDGDANHNSSSDSEDYSILKASSTTTVTVSDAIFDDNTHGGTAAATGANGLNETLTVNYSGRNSTTYGPSTTPPTDAGDYTASASFAGDDNHNSSSDSENYSILKATSTTTVTVSDATYDGNPHGGTAAVTGAGDLNQSETVNYEGRNGTSYGPSSAAPSGAGDYTASANFAGDANHNSSSDSKDFSIFKATPVVNATGGNFAYDENSHAGSGTATGGAGESLSVTLSYEGTGETTYGPSASAPSAIGTYAVTASTTGDANNLSGSSSPATLRIIGAPAITDAPDSVTKNAGDSVTFTVEATGEEPLTYQWKKGITILDGETGSSLTLNDLRAADAATYTVIVADAVGGSTPSSAVLTVVDPYISVPPVDVSANAGSGATFSVTAIGTMPLTYQWKKNGSNLPGETDATLSVNALLNTDEGSYTVGVTNALLQGVVSAPAALTVADPYIATSPANQGLAINQTISLSVTAHGTGLSYQWRKNNSNIPTANASTYSKTGAQVTDSGSYTVVVTGADGSVTSAVATVSVELPIKITKQPAKLVKKVVGQMAVFSVTATGSNLGYQWKVGPTDFASATNVTGANSSSFVLNPITSYYQGSNNVYVTVSNGAYSTNSVAAPFEVLADVKVPSKPAVIYPKANKGHTNAIPYTMTINGTAKDDARVETVLISINGSAYTPATLNSNGPSILWNTNITTVPGTNFLNVKSVDYSGQTSIVTTVKFYEDVWSPFGLEIVSSPSVADDWFMIQSVTNAALGTNNGLNKLLVGRGYKLTIKQTFTNGYIFTNWTYSAENVSAGTVLQSYLVTNTLKLDYVMRTNMTLTANFVTNKFRVLQGTYNGLFAEADATRQNSAGWISGVKVSEKFGVSGKLFVDGNQVSFSGKFNIDGSASAIGKRYKSFAKSDLTVNLGLDIEGDSQQLTGNVVDVTNGWTAPFTADRKVWGLDWDGTQRPATQYTNAYTWVLPGFATTNDGPTGWSYASATVDTNGMVKTAVTTADGQTFTQSTYMSTNADISFHAALYKDKLATNAIGGPIVSTRGTMMGWLSLQDNLTPIASNYAPTGEVTWIKTAWTNTSWTAGFTNNAVTGVPIIGSVHKAFLPPTPIYAGTDFLAIMSEGALVSGGFTNLVSLDPLKNSFVVDKKNTSPPYPYNHKFVISLTPKTGIVTGTFTNENNMTAIKWGGAMLQDYAQGFGYFMNTTPGITNGGGKVTVQP